MMLPKLSRYALIVLAIVVMSIYLPNLYHKVFDKKTGKTQLFFSPVIKKFVFREMVGEGHRFVTQDESGKNYDRQTFDKQTIKKNRQVFELKPRMIADRSQRVQVFPLLESQPGITRLRFPEDAFRMNDRMEFINVDTNTVDEELTEKFTRALKQAGFIFPSRLASGRVSILKSFDEGFFMVDAKGSVFHTKRVKGKPFVVKTPIPVDMGVRNIKVSENRKREIYGTLLTKKGDIYLITYDNYRLIKMPLINYNPDTMDFKLLINPLYRTAVYSDDHTIYAVAMDSRYSPIARYEKEMFSGRRTIADRICETLFPFYIKNRDRTSDYIRFDVIGNGRLTLIGIALSLFFAMVIMYVWKFNLKKNWPDLAVIMFTGIYGLIAIAVIKPEP